MTDAVLAHRERRERHQAEALRLEALGLRHSVANLVLFGAGLVLGGSGLSERSAPLVALGVLLFVGFAASYVRHGRIAARREHALVRARIHERQLARIHGTLDGLDGGDGLAPVDHPYAGDLDVLGPGSLFARLAVAHTEAGRRALASWLLGPADEVTIRARQAAVDELARAVDFREHLEAAVLETGHARLDAAPFLEFVKRPAFVQPRAWLALAATVLPPIALVLLAFSGGVLPSYTWLPLVVVQGFLAAHAEPHVAKAHSLVVSRSRFVESYRQLFRVIEGARFEAPLLVELQRRLASPSGRATAELARLETWASLFELRQQGLVALVVNPLLLWDLNVLRRVEAWAERVGPRCDDWFTAAGELEALASLATLAHQDPSARFPTITSAPEGLIARGLRHPLLPPTARIANDVRVDAPRHALLITGSNMAGKSTLLRAVGTNIVLALAGGAVTADAFSVPLVRLRASMRVADSLQRGASYFQAELARLRIVVDRADETPPIFFLLDELLRGTNAHARHRGARAVLLHLLQRGGLGLVATHDIALSELEDELASDPRGLRVRNVHFTDVFEDGEMKFDYQLREGVVKTSNALRLLKMAGVDVEEDTSLGSH